MTDVDGIVGQLRGGLTALADPVRAAAMQACASEHDGRLSTLLRRGATKHL